jgi:hypothetical protein
MVGLVAQEGQIIRFKIGEAFPADDPLARWMTVCAMAANDLLLVNRWLIPKLKEEEPSEPYESTYLGRLAAAHLFEAATFLKKSDKRLPAVHGLVAGLSDDAQVAYAELLAIGDGGSGKFYGQLKHARNMVFHYQALIQGESEDYEHLKLAMAGHATDEEEQGIQRGKIEDIPPPITGFRSFFADDVATEMLLPGDTEKDFGTFVGTLAEHIGRYMVFLKAAFNAYTHTRPEDTWHIETVPAADTDDTHESEALSMEQIRWRVVYRDLDVKNFVAGGRGGQDLSGENEASEIVETLKTNLREDFDAGAVTTWLAEQEPAPSGASATLPLTDSLELEIVVKDTSS